MKKKILAAAVALTFACAASAEVAETLYIIGDPAGGWDTSKGVELDKVSDGVFEYSATFDSSVSFGFVKALGGDWDTFNSLRYTPPTRGEVPQEGSNPMEYTGDTTDYSWDLPAGEYHFTVNTNTMELILGGDTPVIKPDQLYFVGEVNDWRFLDDYKMESEGSVFTFSTGTVRAGLDFKLSDSNWKTAYTSQRSDMVAGGTYDVFTGDALPNMAMAEDVANFTIVLDPEAMTITIKGEGADIDELEVDQAPAVYYNLQGIMIENPAGGVFIRVQGGRVDKVRL